MILVGTSYLIETGKEQGHENMTDIVRRGISLFDHAIGGADRVKSLDPRNQTISSRFPMRLDFVVCSGTASNLQFLIPFPLSGHVNGSVTPTVGQKSLSGPAHRPAALSNDYRNLALSAFRKRGLI